MTIYRSSHLIETCISISEELPVNVGNGVTLRRPDAAELEKIRELVHSRNRGWNINAFELEVVEEGPGRLASRPLENAADWHYYLLSDDAGGSAVYELVPALSLLKPEINLSIRVMSQMANADAPPELFGHGLERDETLKLPELELRQSCSVASFLEAEALRISLLSVGRDFEFTRHAMTMWADIRRLPDHSRFRVIGYFSIIESLITHSPRLAESLDSISHQLAGKLKLIGNRMLGAPTIPQTFPKTTEAKIWKKLYSYRSSLAHGNTIDFPQDFALLESPEKAAGFLHEFTRCLLLHSLTEPRLFEDLKEC